MGNLINYYNILKIKELIIISDPVNITLPIIFPSPLYQNTKSLPHKNISAQHYFLW
jgi:hypothetical protein